MADALGAHMSIAGGLHRALERGREVGCSVVQIFLKNQLQWAAKPYTQEDIRQFTAARKATGIRTVFAHSSYLINLATPVPAEWHRAVDVFHDELERAEALGLPFVIIHPGSHKGLGLEAGIRRVVGALDEVTSRTRGYRVRVLLENTAGGGATIGRSFEELAALLGGARAPERLGVCLDTCHLFAAGYDLRTREGYRDVMGSLRPDRGAQARAGLSPERRESAAGLGPRPSREDRQGTARQRGVPLAHDGPALRSGPHGSRDAQGSGAQGRPERARPAAEAPG